MSIDRTFDLIINAGTSSPLVINANQNDSGEIWKFNLYQEDGTKVIPAAGEIVGLKSDGHAIVNAGTVNASGQVVITETAQITAAVGANVFEIVFDSVHGTANFILYVEKSPVDDDADFSESDISAIQQAIAMAIDSATVAALQVGLQNEAQTRFEQDNLLAGGIAGEAATRAAADAVLRQAIDDAAIVPAGSTVVVDNTLSIAGAAADAKKTGDDLGVLNQNFNDAIQKTHGTNLFDPSQNQNNKWYYTTGNTIVNPETANRYIAHKIILDPGETKISIKAYPGTTTNEQINFSYFTDDSGNILSSGGWGTNNTLSQGVTKDIPQGATILLLSMFAGVSYFANGGKLMVNYGDTYPPYEDYETIYMLGGKKVLYASEKPFSTDYYADGSVTDEKTSFLTSGIGNNNLFDPSKAVAPAWYYTTGTTIKYPTALEDNYHYCAYALENVDQYEKVTIRGYNDEYGFNVYRYYFTDATDTIVESGGVSHNNLIAGHTFTVPETAKRLLLSMNYGREVIAGDGWIMLNAGETALPYEPFENVYYLHGVRATGLPNGSVTEMKLANNAVSTNKIQDGAVTPEKLSGAIFDNVKLKCPSTITAIVGDKIELFYKGMINAVNTDIYDVEISYTDNKNHGQGWKRKYTWKPTADDVGTYTMNVSLLNNSGAVIDTATVTVNVVAVPLSPVSEKVILCVGDSLTSGGAWPIELHRRLTGSGGTPAGYGLGNFEFIGTKEKSGVKYEGYGGWTFASYNSANTSDAYMWITCSHDKTDADQHSIYKDSNNVEWYLETIEQDRIKIIRVSASGTLPATGALTWVSGGEHQSDIVYSASEQAAGNPFWDSANNRNDFAAYATRMGVSSIDYCFILLGWNSTSWSETTYKNSANTFINRLLEQFPNCKIVLLGLEVPAYDGFAANYGISWKYWNKLQFVWNLNQWYKDIADGNANVYFANVASEFDTEYNMQTGQMAVNTRNAETVTVQNNGVHPADSGYLQIADVALRALAGII